jgi:hypothetical protein
MAFERWQQLIDDYKRGRLEENQLKREAGTFPSVRFQGFYSGTKASLYLGIWKKWGEEHTRRRHFLNTWINTAALYLFTQETLLVL